MNHNNFSSTLLNSLLTLGYDSKIIRKGPGMYLTGVRVKDGVYESDYVYGAPLKPLFLPEPKESPPKVGEGDVIDNDNFY